jgi:hypothetical protein
MARIINYAGRRVRLSDDNAKLGTVQSVEHHPNPGRDEPYVSPTVRVLFDGEAAPRAVASKQLDWLWEGQWS